MNLFSALIPCWKCRFYMPVRNAGRKYRRDTNPIIRVLSFRFMVCQSWVLHHLSNIIRGICSCLCWSHLVPKQCMSLLLIMLVILHPCRWRMIFSVECFISLSSLISYFHQLYPFSINLLLSANPSWYSDEWFLSSYFILTLCDNILLK